MVGLSAAVDELTCCGGAAGCSACAEPSFMPSLKPFPGIRYRDSFELKDLTCPPYDVISPDEQQRLHERHDHNAIRLELAQTGGSSDEKYGHVAETFSSR